MVELKVPQEVIVQSYNHIKSNLDKWAKRHEFNGSITDKVCGEIGMRMLQQYWGVPDVAVHPVLDNEGDRYDFKWRGELWDVKTRRCVTRPRMDYLQNVLDAQIGRPTDYYVFVVIKDRDYDQLWLVGYIPQNAFKLQAQFHKKGEPSPVNRQMTYLADTWDIPIQKLTSVDKLPTQIKFNSEQGIKTIYKNKDIQIVKDLTSEDYIPTGNTPLYDAIARGIKYTEEGYKKANEVLSKLVGKNTQAATPFVIMLIITDGEENSSRHYDRPKIFEMVGDCKKQKWSFVFMGADMDAWQAGSAIGIRSNTQRFVGAQMAGAFTDFSRQLTSHRIAYTQAMTTDNFQKVAETITTANTNYWNKLTADDEDKDDKDKRTAK